MEIVILDYKTLTNGDISLECFEKFGKVTAYEMTPDNMVAEHIGNADIVLCNKALITAEVIAACPNLKYIGLFATGYNNIDLQATRNRSITVCNAGSYSTEAVAQLTFAILLNHYNKVCKYNNAVKNGEWISADTFSLFHYPIMELSGKALAIIGYGSIGKTVAKIGNAFGMEILIATRTIPKDCPYKIVSIDEAFQLADVLTIHCPLTEKTAGLVNKEHLSIMKKNAFLINTSRGGVVNETDLADALNQEIIAGAGLDVLQTEPMSPDTPMLNAKNCIITPHIAWAGIETRQRLLDIVAENINAFLNGNPQNVII